MKQHLNPDGSTRVLAPEPFILSGSQTCPTPTAGDWTGPNPCPPGSLELGSPGRGLQNRIGNRCFSSLASGRPRLTEPPALRLQETRESDFRPPAALPSQGACVFAKIQGL